MDRSSSLAVLVVKEGPLEGSEMVVENDASDLVDDGLYRSEVVISMARSKRVFPVAFIEVRASNRPTMLIWKPHVELRSVGWDSGPPFGVWTKFEVEPSQVLSQSEVRPQAKSQRPDYVHFFFFLALDLEQVFRRVSSKGVEAHLLLLLFLSSNPDPAMATPSLLSRSLRVPLLPRRIPLLSHASVRTFFIDYKSRLTEKVVEKKDGRRNLVSLTSFFLGPFSPFLI